MPSVNDAPNTISLPTRQREILALAAEGLTDKEIAVRTGMAAGTIKTYWKRLRTKLGAKSRIEVLGKILNGTLAHSDAETQIYRKLLSSMNEFAWLVDELGKLQWINSHFSSYSGLDQETLMTSGCLALMPSEEHAESAQRWALAMTTKRGYEARVHFKSCTGEYLEHQIRLEPHEDESGRASLWMGCAYKSPRV